jgi:hypothetical protein
MKGGNSSSYTQLMKEKLSWQSGTFTLGRDRTLLGELKINGPKSRLYLYDSRFFNARTLEDAAIHGVLRDLTKVSLFDCVSLQSGDHGSPKERRHYARLFPNFVVCGERHLGPNDKVITYAEFLIDDASTLFYDFDAFGTVLNAKVHIADLVRSNSSRIERNIPVGSNPIIQYFTGRHEIVTAKTILGKVSAFHRMRNGLGGPEGVSIENEIWIGIQFAKKRTFHEVQRDITKLLRFFEILIGRRQNLLGLNLRRGGPLASANRYKVFWSHPWRRKNIRIEEPHPGDVLLDPVRATKEFSKVLRGWLHEDDERFAARNRFASSFVEGSSFSVDRTISAANAFDILPLSAVPANVELAAEVLVAKNQCRQIFRSLPSSPERDSVLNALGRIGKSTLKRKVHHRAQFIMNAIGDKLPDLAMVADEAVNCRNYYVHGGFARLNYPEHFDVSAFLTETLEFIFAASELIEAGWDIRSWKESHSGITNPLGRYIINYKPLVARLKTALSDDAPEVPALD